MAIKPPHWCSHAVPTRAGWEDPNTGELFISGRFSQSQIDEFHGVGQVQEQVSHQSPQMLHEAPTGHTRLEDMSKLQLEALGRQYGVELDRRHTKQTLLEQVKGLFDR